MKKELGVKNRLLLMSILPREGSFVTLKIIQEMKMDLSFTGEEIADWEIIENEKGCFWNDKKEAKKEFEFGDTKASIIKSSLKKLDSSGKLPEDCMKLYEMFVLEE